MYVCVRVCVRVCTSGRGPRPCDLRGHVVDPWVTLSGQGEVREGGRGGRGAGRVIKREWRGCDVREIREEEEEGR